ncbi:hypothetical protein WJX74_000511 [Apatococcus lobatus]|uniref:Small ribosomal subunit protein uS15c n=1 Tax=Apatococcus lobatus TaxID=904363 RepID=A0AAW1RQ26_9CHLO
MLGLQLGPQAEAGIICLSDQRSFFIGKQHFVRSLAGCKQNRLESVTMRGSSLLSRLQGASLADVPACAEPLLSQLGAVLACQKDASTCTVRATTADALPEPRPDLVDRYFSRDLMSAGERRKLKLHQKMHEFQRFPGDTGSSEVQAAILTEKIQSMLEHMQQHRKDFHSRRGLEGMLTKRRKVLQYLRSQNFEAYSIVISKLGLKDSFAKQDRLTRQKAGLVYY